ncbi:MAG: TraB/GumN family protein [Oscillospiraceae bacterium]|nr:TraB/GumN family protein [Oscillospiraceae bacterium]
MKKMLSAILALALVLCLGMPALAAEPEAAQEPAPWTYEYLADTYALGLMDDGYGKYIQSPITQDQLTAMTDIVSDKLALLGLPQRGADDDALVIDTTRGGVMNALYQVCADYQMEGIDEGVIPFLRELGVVKGVNEAGDLDLEQPCTYQEAMVMSVRLVLAVYDRADAGSQGLLWKVTNGENTLYLLGTVHVDRSNVYPFHKSLRAALASAQTVIFELDFNDQEGLAEFAAMQTYSDGTTLKDHISPELYASTVQVFADLGMSEEAVAAYKPWALANSLMSLATQDETTTGAPMAIDLYLNSAAVNAGKQIDAVETYAFQCSIFDTLSPEYQEAYLAGYVNLALIDDTLEMTEEQKKELQEAMEYQEKQMDAMMETWKAGDAAAFEEIFDKAAVLESTDELNSRLFTDRDPNMIEYAAKLLEREGENTFFLAVGAGHMVDPGGIVGGLRALGYTVEEL